MAPSQNGVQSVSDLTKNGITASIERANGVAELDASNLKVTITNTPRLVPEPNSPEVWASSTATDHMMTVRWTVAGGWDAPEIKPYGPLAIMPTASCLHYATQCFEGMKCYRGYDGKLRLFRPDRNCHRLNMSSARVALPTFDPEQLEILIKALLKVDGPKWLPKERAGEFLYLRPAMIGNGTQLGVQVPKEALLFVMALPWPDLSVKAQIPGTVAKAPGLKLLASKEDSIRAWPGGFGYAKVGANYGPAFVAHGEAQAQGYDQVLWLLGPECNVTEAGASNFFVVWKNQETGKLELVTAPLDSKIILAGVTRSAVLDLARERLATRWTEYGEVSVDAIDVIEKDFTMYELEEAVKEGRLVEAFVSGTAFFITPVSKINFRGKDIEIPLSAGTSGPYAGIIKKWLGDIMYGREEHEFGVVVDENDI